MVTANTTKTGTSGTTYYLKRLGGSDWTPPASGSMVYKITFRPLGTNSNATVVRIFLNNGSTDATEANNILLHEVTLDATTLNEAAAFEEAMSVALNLVIPSGCKIFLTLGTAPTSAGWKAWLSGMDYE
jgi:hypothetical protein